MTAILYDYGNPKSGMLASDQNLATVWLASGSSTGIAFKPYLVMFKGGTPISFYRMARSTQALWQRSKIW